MIAILERIKIIVLLALLHAVQLWCYIPAGFIRTSPNVILSSKFAIATKPTRSGEIFKSGDLGGTLRQAAGSKTTEVGFSNDHSELIIEGGDIFLYNSADDSYTIILEGYDERIVEADVDINGRGAFISFDFNGKSNAKHDVRLGGLDMSPEAVHFVSWSRIKRWWMAPSFGSSADDVPVETQLFLLELKRNSRRPADAGPCWDRPGSNNVPVGNGSGPPPAVPDQGRKGGEQTEEEGQKVYVLIAPLIDYSSGFRVSLFGKEGGRPAGDGMLAARAESGCPDVKTSTVLDALYIKTGTDPYRIVHEAYVTIANRMGTFRVRTSKPRPANIDLFGFCTWDAFYSSVSSDKVIRGVEALRDAGLPPKVVIIDDGWQSTANVRSPSANGGSGAARNGATIGGQLDTDQRTTIFPQLIDGGDASGFSEQAVETDNVRYNESSRPSDTPIERKSVSATGSRLTATAYAVGNTITTAAATPSLSTMANSASISSNVQGQEDGALSGETLTGASIVKERKSISGSNSNSGDSKREQWW